MKRWRWVFLGLLVVAGLGAGTTLALLRWYKPSVEQPRPGGRGVAEWIALLGNDDPHVAQEAEQKLRDMGAEAVPVLLEARKQSNMHVHRVAAWLLTRSGQPGAEALIETLPHGGGRVEVALIRMGAVAVPGLEKALSGSDPAPAARVLGEMGRRARGAVPELTGVVQDGGATVANRVAAVQALGQIGADLGPEVLRQEDNAIVVTLSATLADERLRLAAARSLATLGQAVEMAVPDLARLTRERDADLAAAACQALGASGSPAAAVPLVAALGRSDRTGPTAALALARLGPAARPAFVVLIAALKKGKNEGRLVRAVLERLGAIILPELQAALKDANPAIRQGAAEVLGLLGPRAAAASKALAERLKDEQPEVVLAAAQACGRVDPQSTPEAVTALGKLLRSDNAEVAAGAALVLAELGPAAAPLTPELLKMLSDKDNNRAARSAALLGGLRPLAEGVIAALQSGLGRAEVVRLACIEALGRLGEAARPALADLRKALDDPAVRPAAALALMRISPDERNLVAETLAPDLASKDESVKVAALAALATMDSPPVAILPAVRPLLGDARLGKLALLVLAGMDRVTRLRFVPDLIGLLGSQDVGLQLQAAQMLQQLGVVAVPALLRAAKSSSQRTRIGALIALRNEQIRAALKDRKVFLESIEDADPVVRQQACETLGLLGVSTPDDVQAAIGLLGRPETDLRRAAARALGHAPAEENPKIGPVLSECTIDPDEIVREEAALSLKGRPFDEEFLVSALDDGSSRVRLAAAETLRSRQEPSRVNLLPTLMSVSHSAPPAELFRILELLVKIDRSQADKLRGRLAELTRGDELSDRIRAAVWLVRLDPAQLAATLPFLESIVVGWDSAARLEAAQALAQLGRQAAPASATLRRRLTVENDRDVREALEKALRAIKE